MKKIKIIGFFIVVVSILLIFISHTISQLQEQEKSALSVVEKQKSYTQDISKAILYTQRHQKTLPKGIDKTIYDLFGTLHRGQADDRKIDRIGQEFYRLINEFKYLYVKNIPYYTTIMEKEINDIYKKSMELIMALNQRAATIKQYYEKEIHRYRLFQYALFALLLLLLVYIFTQMDEVIRFVQKFTRTSERILEKSSLKGLEPMELGTHNTDLSVATHNFNTLVSNIDSSIKIATDSTAHTAEMLESVEENIELLLSLLYEMSEDERESLYKKEEAIIESLEKLMELTSYLKKLKKELRTLL